MSRQIRLNEIEQRLAEHVGLSRRAARRRAGSVDRMLEGLGAERMDVEGYGAELAVSKLLGLYPDLEILAVPPVSDGVIDCALNVWGFGKKVQGEWSYDIKWTKYRSGKLMVTKEEGNRSEIYILVVGKMPRYEVVGWAWEHELFVDENVEAVPSGMAWCMKQADLNDIEELL